jgi:hypothetical protein
MSVPGVIMRFSDNPIESPLNIPGVEAQYVAKADDDKTPSWNTIFFVKDISPLLASSQYYDADVAASREASSPSWVICSYINGRDTAGTVERQTTPHVPPSSPIRGSILVINGSTPREDKENDYHRWYDQEHGGKLTQVPGWRASRRYALSKAYGSVDVAKFYGFNLYDEENGLGGPEWKAGVTEWTLRIRSNAAKPNIRRVWKVEKTG